jgi:hypothetical protein
VVEALSAKLAGKGMEVGEGKGRKKSTQQSSERAICKKRKLSAH